MPKRDSTPWIESRQCWSGETIPAPRMEWSLMNQKRLLKAQTNAEKYFGKWFSGLAGKGKSVFRFTKQKPFHVTPEFLFYIDFYFKRFKLAVELDGAHHLTTMGKAQDEVRTKLLSAKGIRVIRFQNDTVLADITPISHSVLRAMYRGKTRPLSNRMRKELRNIARRRPKYAQWMIPEFLLKR